MPVANFNPSPLLLHQPTPTPNPSNPFQMPQSPSRSASASPSVFNSAGSTAPASTTSSPHQIPFNPTPVHHAPSPLGFGFGFGSSFGNNNATAGPSAFASPHFGQSPSSSAATNALAHSFASPNSVHASASPKRPDTKRRRDLDGEQDDEDMDRQLADSPRLRANHALPADPARQIVPKRLRAGIAHFSVNSQARAFETFSNLSGVASQTKSSASRPKNVMSGLEVDLGKMLASMDKASLLTMLHKLLAQSKDADLGAQILSLLPTPSLESVEAALDEVEKNIRAAIPFVAQNGTTGVRDEYTWSRVRAPITAFADTALSYMPFFVTELDKAVAGLSQGTSADASTRKADREEVHPATTFTFLHALTVRVLRIHALLPPVPKTSLSFNSLRQDRASAHHGFGFAFASASATSQGGPSGSGTLQQRPASDNAHENLANRLASQFTSPSSPDALMSTLMPVLLKQWTVLLQRLDRAVNVEGRMFGQEVVLGWARALDAVGSRGQVSASGETCFSFGAAQSPSQVSRQPKGEETAVREIMDEVRHRLERHLGWLVGGNDPVQALPRPAEPQRHEHQLHHHQQQQHHHHQQQQQQQQQQQNVQKRSATGPQVSESAKRARSTSMDDEEEL